MKILLADDTPANIQILHRVFADQGLEIFIATSGDVALENIRRSQPDLVLLDIMMPGLSGFEVCKALKEDEATRDIPVIFISAKNETEDIVEGFDLGAVDYVVKPFRLEEVIARVTTQLRLRRVDQENQKLVEAKNVFLGMAAHDLRNPLVCIRGFSELLKDEDLDVESQIEYKELIHSVSNEMLTILNDLLDISQIESGKLKLTLKPNDLGKLVERRVHLNKNIAKKKEIQILSELESLPSVQFDFERMGQVLDNFISNAIKFSPQGTVIRVRLKQSENKARIEVVDEGPGISEDEISQLFGEFQKLSSRPTAGESSTGLGLAIVKKIVNAHGGEVGVTSEVGRGSSFYFCLPLDAPA
ncbi:MAG: hybrid sensor histidine kinase/response regulator [Candidatus Nitrohelix vancouverensis]|uniref:histidine kinase n=1 Tax=Candidatus Nitrohelix vancouverensis TaxID=2705534 RepID=A0A7T0G2N2_9BACT|nr:MAG: hybrid sensor histidine kinase/response regulator [Candidatus Nitrohelix vancouverensis]